MARRELRWWGVASAVVHATVDVVRARLSHTCGSYVLVALIDGILHLLKELIDIDQIVLGANIGHRREVISRSRRTARAVSPTTATCDRDGCGHGLIFRYWAVENWQLESLEAKKPLPNGGIRAGIELTTLQVTEELVQRVVTPLAIIRGASIRALAKSVVDIAI
jgi:hypothetical protein